MLRDILATEDRGGVLDGNAGLEEIIQTTALQHSTLRFTRERRLADFWREALQKAPQWAMHEMGQPPAVPTLTWEDVFATEYRLPED